MKGIRTVHECRSNTRPIIFLEKKRVKTAPQSNATENNETARPLRTHANKSQVWRRPVLSVRRDGAGGHQGAGKRPATRHSENPHEERRSNGGASRARPPASERTKSTASLDHPSRLPRQPEHNGCQLRAPHFSSLSRLALSAAAPLMCAAPGLARPWAVRAPTGNCAPW